MTLAYQAGANPVDEQGRLTLNTPEFLEALKFEQELLKYAPPGTAGYAFDELSRLYQQGKVAMVFHGGWFIDQTRKAAPEIFEVTGLLPVLAGPTGIQRSIGFFNGWMIFKQSKHPEEAKKFLDHLMKPETLGRLYEAHLGGLLADLRLLDGPRSISIGRALPRIRSSGCRILQLTITIQQTSVQQA